ncbi:MAG: divalent-cation tolerance protein CutA [Chloroflexota bacterium]
MKYYQVMTTCPSEIEAKRIARALVEMRLAACAQVSGPVRSTYWWKGKIEKATEWVCLLKCPVRNYARIENAIRQMHSYRVPEVLAMPVGAGNKEYLEWLEAEAVPVVATDANSHTGKLSGLKRRAPAKAV